MNNSKSKYRIYTKEEKEARREMIAEAKRNIPAAEIISNLLGLTLIGMRKGERYLKTKEHGSIVIDMKQNVIYWNTYGNKAMDIYEFIHLHQNCSMSEAIDMCLSYYVERDPQVAEIYNYEVASDRTYVSSGLDLPEPNKNDEIATNYLIETRRISEFVIEKLRNKGMFYEDTYHNCVFVGYNADEKPVFANRRGTIPGVKFQRDCSGSFKKCGFFIQNRFPVKKLVLTECVIDGLSYLSLNRNLIDAHVLASSGAGCAASTLWYNRATRTVLQNVEEIVCAFDNDHAGRNAEKQVREYIKQNNLDVKVSTFSYEGRMLQEGEDLNEFLIKLRESEDSEQIRKEDMEDELE